jgi:tRNA-2-methylthio-N6-dimethylallyladenosine synthase
MPSFALVTFGCQMNQHDSARIEELLQGSGYRVASGPEDADLVLVNTCSVREKAIQKLRSELGRLSRLKRDRPEVLLAVTGCVAQQEGDRLVKKMPYLDLVVGPDRLPELPAAVRELEGGGPPRVLVGFDVARPRFLAARLLHGQPKPAEYVTISKGCDEACTFCIVPHTRGPERHRPKTEILAEIERLVESGTREVTLLGQTVNGYRDPVDPTSDFASLLRSIAERVPGLRRLRYTSSHPRYLTDSLTTAHEELRPLCRHLHLPVQSGSDRVLKRMVRRHTVAEYRERVDNLRARVPDLALSTDVIVGFPGETREDFELTLDLVRTVGFAGVFGFKYSPRPHTPALRWPSDVSDQEQAERLAELFRLSDRLLADHLSTMVGRIERVLVEGSGEDGAYQGRTERNEIVHFGSRDDPTGEIVEVRVTNAFKHSLGAELLDPERIRPLRRARPALPLAV